MEILLAFIAVFAIFGFYLGIEANRRLNKIELEKIKRGSKSYGDASYMKYKLSGVIAFAKNNNYLTDAEAAKLRDFIKLSPSDSSWKPSEEQIGAVVESLKYLPNNKSEYLILDDLIDDLKKLAEENK